MAVKEFTEIKEKLARATRIMVNEGLIELSGHPSTRVPGTDHLCVLGHLHEEGRTLRATSTEDIITVDMDGKLVEGNHEPPGEIYLHTEIYKARSDVSSVLHTHPPVTIALGIAGIPVKAVWLAGAAFGQGVPIFESACQIDTPEIGQKLAQVLGNQMAVMLKGHGAVTVGVSIEQACSISLNLEKTAKLMLMAGQFGQVPPMSAEDLARYSNRGRTDSEESRKGFWAYYGERLPQ